MIEIEKLTDGIESGLRLGVVALGDHRIAPALCPGLIEEPGGLAVAATPAPG